MLISCNVRYVDQPKFSVKKVRVTQTFCSVFLLSLFSKLINKTFYQQHLEWVTYTSTAWNKVIEPSFFSHHLRLPNSKNRVENSFFLLWLKSLLFCFVYLKSKM